MNGTLTAVTVCTGLMFIGFALMTISVCFLRTRKAWHRGMVLGTCMVLPNDVRLMLESHGTLRAIFFFGLIALVLLIFFGDKLHE